MRNQAPTGPKVSNVTAFRSNAEFSIRRRWPSMYSRSSESRQIHGISSGGTTLHDEAEPWVVETEVLEHVEGAVEALSPRNVAEQAEVELRIVEASLC